jgi:YfiR/HmsC-like
MICLVITSVPAYAASASDEYRVKAAYLYNFAKFITWSENPASDTNEPFIIGVLGTNSFDGSLESLTAKTVRNRPIVIQQFDKPAEVENCQILYLNLTDEKALEQSLKSLSKKAIVTVSDQKGFALRGGTIQFIEVRDRLRFIINKTIADKQKIKIGSQLLSLAIDVLEDK